MKYTFLDGKDIVLDTKKIEKEMENDKNHVFVYTNKKTALYAYIDKLDKEGGLSDEKQLKLKICYERENLDLSWYGHGKNTGNEEHITSMSQLLERLDGSSSYVVVNDDKRNTLAEVVQQLIYIGYPLAKMEIMLRKEEKDYERAERFMRNIDHLEQQLSEALRKLDLTELYAYDRAYEENMKRLKEVTDTCRRMEEQFKKAQNRNMKIAVAATKKAGKSVIVNSMIGDEIAPTSLELATPNTCIYRKSNNRSYYLNYNGQNLSFNSAAEIYEKIDKEFKKAQENVSQGFSIPDMEIGYVSDKNNFEAYTIYDTPGPDAAGTSHSELAWKSMEQCDAAIFAIDYSKYLTTSEEDYLKNIKKMFNDQKKFDSLIFTINKIDTRYQDVSGSKSVIKAVDFIRKRLKDIDPFYNDCAIFATSALQYFNILEAEKVCGDELRGSTDLYNDLRPMKKKYKAVKAQLSFLDSQVGYMESQSELENITLEDLRQYSGMPDLLGYVAYIAKTKARNELVNAVAYEIDADQAKIRGVISWVENLKKLMNENEEEINKITQIFRELEEETGRILKDEIEEKDIQGVENGQKKGKLSRLRVYQNDFEKQRKIFSFKEIGESEGRQIQEAFRSYKNVDNFNNAHAMFYEALKHNYWNAFETAKNNKDILHKENDWLGTGMVSDTVYEIRSRIMERERSNVSGGAVEELNDECNHVLNNRIQWLRKEMDECKEKLHKMNCDYDMPNLPVFDVVSSEDPCILRQPVKKEDLREVLEGLDKLYKKTNFLQNLLIYFKDHTERGKEKRKARQIDEEEFEKIFKGAKDDINNMARKIGLSDYIQKDGEQLAKGIQKRILDIEKHFQKLNKEFTENIRQFAAIIDDREKYKDDQKRLEAEESFINKIAEIMNEFLDSWKDVVNPEENGEENMEGKFI